MKKRKQQRRKIRIFRLFMIGGIFIVFTLCTFRVVLAFINHEKVLAPDSEAYVIPESGLPIELVDALAKNSELRKFVSEYPQKKDKIVEINIQDDIEKGEVPLFMQWDERWGYQTYGDNLMGLSGCGPTALSMVLVYLQNDERWNPYEVAMFAQENGYYEDGAGSTWSLMDEGAQALGINAKSIALDESVIVNELQKGNPIICSVGPGDFTTKGHFIVLAGMNKHGDFMVRDPNRIKNSDKTWDYATLEKQIVGLWAYAI